MSGGGGGVLVPHEAAVVRGRVGASAAVVGEGGIGGGGAGLALEGEADGTDGYLVVEIPGGGMMI